MDVVYQRDQGLLRGQDLQEPPCRPECLFLGERGGGQPDRCRQSLRDVGVCLTEQRGELPSSGLQRIVVLNARGSPNHLGEWVEGDSLAVREASSTQGRCRVGGIADELL